MSPKFKLITIALIVMVVTAVTMLIAYSPRLFTWHKAMSKVGNTVINESVIANGRSTISLNMPIYVVGPSTLIQKLIDTGINQSLIKSISLNQLPELPNDSIVVIDWSLIKSSLVIGDPMSKVTINLTSPITRELADSIAKGDIVGIYANGSDEGIIEFVLAYSWAVATNHRLIFTNGEPSNDYLLAYPIIPVNMHQPMIIIAKRIGVEGLVIGPVYLNQLPVVIMNMMMPAIVIGEIADPCYVEFAKFQGKGYASLAPGIYVNNGTLVWTTPMFLSKTFSDYGIEAYVDGNGTYYWDTCLATFNPLGNTGVRLYYPPAYYFLINVLGFEAYTESTAMYDNYGYINDQVGAIDYYSGYQLFKEGITNALVGDVLGGFNTESWNPPPISTSSYDAFFGVYLGGVPSVTVGMDLPLGASETIIASFNPQAAPELFGMMIQVPNITWIFDIGYGANGAIFPNSFEDISPASVFMPNLSFSIAQFNVDFENSVITAQYPCAYEIYQIIWVDTTWDIVVVPQSGGTVSLSQSSLLLNSANAPPGTYITGITSYYMPIICSG
ncbi:hypothetical protein [Vulcanisaeta distributa]|nr:hypothetical protein [Vulcanisaeta distributa]